MLIAVEVANAQHVKLALQYDVDVLWIGARTTVNPFAVQEIADALKNSNKIVLLKNPVNPDLSLWIGGIERLQKAGIQKLGVIHRGFSTYEKTKYGNNPEWQIPIELHSKFPNLPLICDPSHITGKRNMIQEVSQQALDLSYDGLMIETHCNPDAAWSDAAQQITPEVLKQLFVDLKVRKVFDETTDFNSRLTNLRTQIDELDSKLITILANRMQIADAIGQVKKEKNVAVLQSNRWNEVLRRMIAEGEGKGLSEEFILKLYKAIHQESIVHQEKVFKS